MADQDVTETIEYLTHDEFSAALGKLSEDDRIKLLAIEARFLARTTRKPGDLFHEAVVRTLLGKRRCPKVVAVIAFLIKTMKSIASHDYKARRKNVSLEVVSDALASNELDPEQHLLATEDQDTPDVLSVMLDLLKGDEKAQSVVLGWSEGLRGEALRDFVCVDQGELDYAAKRVRRMARKHYPDGWV